MPTDRGWRRGLRSLTQAACAWVALVTAAAATDNSCLPDGSGFLTARLRGAMDLDLDWRGGQLACTGMPRPDGRGIRMRFSAQLPEGGTLAIVFAPPRLEQGVEAKAVPVNVTVLAESSGRIYATRGEDRCLLDEVHQEQLAVETEGKHSWAVSARGFCMQPARSLVDGEPLLLARFDFRGLVSFGDEQGEDRQAHDQGGS